MHRFTKSRFMRFLMCVAMALHPIRVRSAEPPSQSQAQYERELLMQELKKTQFELAKTKEFVQQMMVIQARQLADSAVREELAKNDLDAAKKLIERLGQEPDFGSEAGKALRDTLKKSLDELSAKPITPTSTKADVDRYIADIKALKNLAQSKRDEALHAFQNQKKKLPPDVQGAIDTTIDIKRLESLGEQKLQEVLQKLDPTLSAEELSKLTKSDLAARISQFARNGHWSAEQIAALGSEAFEKITGENLPDGFVQSAADLADTHRSVADFAMASAQLLQAAISTGNPYVIAAAVLIIALIALFKWVFGGGGGGEGEGDGQADGKRNKGAENDGKVPGEGGPTGPPGPTPQPGTTGPFADSKGFLPGTDPNGEFGVKIEGGVARVIDKSGSEQFKIDLAKLKTKKGNIFVAFRFELSKVKKATSVDIGKKTIQLDYDWGDGTGAEATTLEDTGESVVIRRGP